MRIGRIRIIFCLPEKVLIGSSYEQAAPAAWPRHHLAYIEWFQNLGPNPDPIHGMFVVRKYVTQNSQFSILSLAKIRQACMLFPYFGKNSPPKDWKSSTTLDLSTSFLLNNWQSLYTYQTLW